ncbi:sigma-70 family RNA polymerase sigma factor [Maribacter sp.]|uniref:RNA polymerase sigma factor n=1 Tax=Maribacter sp. TaxID=1897614 RepID=UPI0025BBDD75|nr:sigma-70 family RNA polymerase sigma factor [Maribacter sp.]
MNFNHNSTLIKSLKKGDEKAYTFLLQKYHRGLQAYALTLVNDQALAKDIVQNVFLKTWEFRKKLNDKFSVKNFLYKSVYNEFINTYKRNKSSQLLQLKYYNALTEVVEELDEKKVEKMINTVTCEIENLPPKCKQIFYLSKKEGLTNVEISAYLSISTKTVEAQITKAFRILRSKLENKMEIILFYLYNRTLQKN